MDSPAVGRLPQFCCRSRRTGGLTPLQPRTFASLSWAIPSTRWPGRTRRWRKLKAVGFNEVQLNIAWGYRPFDEPLNLIDVVTVPGEADMSGTAARRAELKRRGHTRQTAQP